MLLSVQQRRYDESYNTHEISEKLKSVNTPDGAVTKTTSQLCTEINIVNSRRYMDTPEIEQFVISSRPLV